MLFVLSLILLSLTEDSSGLKITSTHISFSLEDKPVVMWTIPSLKLRKLGWKNIKNILFLSMWRDYQKQAQVNVFQEIKKVRQINYRFPNCILKLLPAFSNNNTIYHCYYWSSVMTRQCPMESRQGPILRNSHSQMGIRPDTKKTTKQVEKVKVI